MSIMYVCTDCAEHSPETCGHYDPAELRVMPDGRWICDGCFDECCSGDQTWGDLKAPPEYTPIISTKGNEQ